MTSRMTLLAALALSGVACAKTVTYGELPPGATSITEYRDVSGEICGDHILNPVLVQPSLPTGYRLMSAADYAKEDPDITALVKRDERYANYGVGTLCFVSLSSFLVAGVPAHEPGVAAMAFWWVRAEGPRDSRMRGDVNWVQLASWYGPKFTARDRVVSADPMAQFADVEMTQVDPDLWRLRLPLTNEAVYAEVSVTGPRIKRSAPEPGFTTVPLSGNSAAYFMVFTYFGHHLRSAGGKWEVTGSGIFSEALRTANGTSVFKTFLEDGWQGLSGLYKL
jgi:hypothetical protein